MYIFVWAPDPVTRISCLFKYIYTYIQIYIYMYMFMRALDLAGRISHLSIYIHTPILPKYIST